MLNDFNVINTVVYNTVTLDEKRSCQMTTGYYIVKSVNILLSAALFSAHFTYKLSKLPPIVKTGSLLALFLV